MKGRQMKKIISIKVLEKYCLFVELSDGVSGIVDLSKRLFGPVFEPLKDEDFFSQAHIDEFGVVCWPNNADIAPEALYAWVIRSS